MRNKHIDFAIVGAPKCGTTSLASWLSVHPDVVVSDNKEPRFYCDWPQEVNGPGARDYLRHFVQDEGEYAALFAKAQEGQIRGEASVAYLSDPSAAAKIKSDNPDCKVVICLRNPVDRSYSEHCHLVRDGYESESFEVAMEREDERYSEHWWPIFFHRRRSTYSRDVERYINIFGERAVHVIFYEDLKRDAGVVMRRLCEFLGIEYIDDVELSRENASGVPRSYLLSFFINNRFVRMLAPLVRWGFVRNIYFGLKKANTGRSPEMSSETRVRLMEIFSDDISSLSSLLGRDLGFWV